MESESIKHVHTLIEKASKVADNPVQAQYFAQAALNAANAIVALHLNIKPLNPG